jgi:hypothetical protein
MKKRVLLIFIVLISGCIKPIELDSIIKHEPTIIIDALLTNEYKHHIVKLSKAIPLDSIAILKESNAQIKIIDNDNIVYNFSEGEKGIYSSDDIFKAEKGKKYTLEVVTNDGTKYTSNQEEMYGFNSIDQIEIKKENNVFNEEVLAINVKSDGTNNVNAQYYRYKYEETFKVIAPYWSDEMFDKTKLPRFVIVPNTKFDKICYGSKESNGFILKESTFLNEKKTEFSIYHLKEDDYKVAHRYSVLIKQYVQSPEAHSYSKKIVRNATSQSFFSESQPGAVIGNMNSDKKVIGYFEVSSVSEKRVFFNHSDFFEYSQNNFKYPALCNLPYAPPLSHNGTSAITLLERLNGDWIFHSYIDPNAPPYKIVRKDCGDCKKYGVTIKPNFWID